MGRLLYYLILLPLSWLPLPVLYLFSNLLYFVGFTLAGYRRNVVRENISGSFPDWSDKQIDAQVRKFYRYFFDSIVESVKLTSMSGEEALRRCRVENPESIDHLAEENRSLVMWGAHYANYEIASLSFPLAMPKFTTVGIYSPLKNEAMNRLVKANRERTGSYLVSRRDVAEYFAEDPVRPAMDYFIADQSPSNAAWWKIHWTPFLHRNTSFLAGPERYAVRHDRPVYYVTLRLVKRGYYSARLHCITDEPRNTEPGFITEACARILEKEIIRDPTPWLWTHRRWKRGVAPEAAEKLTGQPYLPADYSR